MILDYIEPVQRELHKAYIKRFPKKLRDELLKIIQEKNHSKFLKRVISFTKENKNELNASHRAYLLLINCSNLIEASSKRGKFDKVYFIINNMILNSITLHQEMLDPKGEAWGYYYLAVANFLKFGATDITLDLFDKALIKSQTSDEKILEHLILFNQGKVKNENKSILLIKKAIIKAKENNDWRFAVAYQNYLGYISTFIYKTEKNYMKALDIAINSNQNCLISKQHHILGLFYIGVNQDLSWKHLKKAKLLAELDNEGEMLNILLGSYGIAYESEGLDEKALNMYNSLLQKIKKQKLSSLKVSLLVNKAFILYKRGEYKKALKTYENILEIDIDIGCKVSQVVDLINIASIYLKLKDYNSALKTCKKCYSLFNGLKIEKKYRELCLRNKAEALYQLKRFQDAEIVVDQLVISQNINEKKVSYLNTNGIISFNAGDYEKALAFFKKAILSKESIHIRYCLESNIESLYYAKFLGNKIIKKTHEELIPIFISDSRRNIYNLNHFKEYIKPSFKQISIKKNISIKEKPKLNVCTGNSFGSVSGGITAVAISPDDKIIATGGSSGAVVLWEKKSARMIYLHQIYSGSISSIEFSADGRFLLITACEGIVKLMNIKKKELSRIVVPSTVDLNDCITRAKFTHDGKSVLVMGVAEVFLFNIKKNEVVKVFSTEKNEGNFVEYTYLYDFDISPDGKFVAASGADRSNNMTGCTPIFLWDFTSTKLKKKMSGHSAPIISIAFSPDAKKLVSLSTIDNTIKIWDILSGNEINCIEITDQIYEKFGHPKDVQFYLDGGHLITTDYVFVGSADVWSLELNKPVKEIGRGVTRIAISKDKKSILTGGFKGVSYLLDPLSGNILKKYSKKALSINKLVVDKNNKYLILSSGDDNNSYCKGENIFWDLSNSKELERIQMGNYTNIVTISPDGKKALLFNDKNIAFVWDFEKGVKRKINIPSLFGKYDSVNNSICFTVDNSLFVVQTNNYCGDKLIAKAMILNTNSFEKKKFNWQLNGYKILAIAPQKKLAITASDIVGIDKKEPVLFNLETGKKLIDLCRPEESYQEGTLATFCPDEKYLSIVYGKHLYIYDIPSGKIKSKILEPFGDITTNAFTPDGRMLIITVHKGGVNLVKIFNISTNRFEKEFIYIGSPFKNIFITQDSRFLITASCDGMIGFWDINSGVLLASLFFFETGKWAVVDSEGRFDSNRPDDLSELSWILNEEPLKPLPLELFMRQYYQPGLLQRILNGDKFLPVVELKNLNIVQPIVEIKNAYPVKGKKAFVSVDVEVEENRKDLYLKKQRSGVYDLRLYLNKRLVAQLPEPSNNLYKSIGITSKEDLDTWRKATQLKLGKDGKLKKTFTIKLPRRNKLNKVEFTAYAFNADRVKSESSTQEFILKRDYETIKGNCYILAVGVSDNQDFYWRLSSAAEDAKLALKILLDNFDNLGFDHVDNIFPIPLITAPKVSLFDEVGKKERKKFIKPNKGNIKSIIDALAGREIKQSFLEEIPKGVRKTLKPLQPDDVLILFVSSHGVRDEYGEFYILPYDIGTGSRGGITKSLLNRSISSQELAFWLSRLNSERMFLIIDTCHASAAVDTYGFKPGPMGNPGLGQLCCDKKMPILTATQANNSAWSRKYSLLTLALFMEGIGQKKMSLIDALRYSETRVPKLYKEIMWRQAKWQQPKLFDFQ